MNEAEQRQAVAEPIYPLLEMPQGVRRHAVTIWRDGLPLDGDVYRPEVLSDDEKLPALVLCHGCGGSKLTAAGNITCLDVVRALSREPDLIDLLFSDLDDMSYGCPILADELLHLFLLLQLGPDALEASARLIAQQLVLIAQACLLRRYSTPEMAEAFVRTRFGDRRAGRVVGAIDPASVQTRAILSRALTD